MLSSSFDQALFSQTLFNQVLVHTSAWFFWLMRCKSYKLCCNLTFIHILIRQYTGESHSILPIINISSGAVYYFYQKPHHSSI
ncbi:hypothetical protein MGSAQ_000054 [marine sediment metagenome]|uniref:Uncharacterized protein n=1 Tax=marine sediment metagenome TaxID=412755 RepID=A0A1B6NYH9_9ZZZZ